MTTTHTIDVEAETRAAIKFAEVQFRNEDEFTERDLTMVQAGWLAAKRSIQPTAAEDVRDAARYRFATGWYGNAAHIDWSASKDEIDSAIDAAIAATTTPKGQ